MVNEDLYAVDFPHGTEAGFRRGCHSNGACPANVEFDQSCSKAHSRYTMDHAYRRVVDNGGSLEVQRTSEREVRRMLSDLNHIPEGDVPSVIAADPPARYETATEREAREVSEREETAHWAALGPEMTPTGRESEFPPTAKEPDDPTLVQGLVRSPRETFETFTQSARSIAVRESTRRQREHALATVAPDAPFGRTLSGKPRLRQIPGVGKNARPGARALAASSDAPTAETSPFRRLVVDDWVDAEQSAPAPALEDLDYLREQSDRVTAALVGFDARALGDRLAEVASTLEALGSLTRALGALTRTLIEGDHS